jgi:hypothetical protein
VVRRTNKLSARKKAAGEKAQYRHQPAILTAVGPQAVRTASTQSTGAAHTRLLTGGRKLASEALPPLRWVGARPQSARKCTIAGLPTTTSCPSAPSVGKAPSGRERLAATAGSVSSLSAPTRGRAVRAAGQEAACGIDFPSVPFFSLGRKVRRLTESGGGLDGSIGARVASVLTSVPGVVAKWL